MIRLGRYTSRSEAIRDAIKDMLKRELWVSDEELKVGRGSSGSLSKTYTVRAVRVT